MNKQRMSNILSSIQMNPRNRKDFIDELSKLGQGGQGGGEVPGEVSSEHPVKIIELTQEELMGGTELDITVEEYLKYSHIIMCNMDEIKFEFHYKYSYEELDMGSSKVHNVYIINNKTRSSPSKLIVDIYYKNDNLKNTIFINPINIIDSYGDINFNLTDRSNDYNLQIISSINLSKSYSVILFKDGSTIHGNYYNGIFTAFAEGKIQIYNVNSETGAITLSKSIDLLTLADKLAEL